MSLPYQRRYLRAPLRERMLFADGPHVSLARLVNISEDGVLIDQLPHFPEGDEIPLMINLPLLPQFKNASLQQIEAISHEVIPRRVVRAKGHLVRRQELSQNLDNIFRSKFALQFDRLLPLDRKLIDQYVSSFSSNLVHLQTLIDSFHYDQDAKERCRLLASVMGYKEERIAQLKIEVNHDYQSLQWL